MSPSEGPAQRRTWRSRKSSAVDAAIDFLRRAKAFGDAPGAPVAVLCAVSAAVLLLLEAVDPGGALSLRRSILVPAAGIALLAALVLNSGRLARARDWFASVGWTEPRFFWTTFSLLLVLGLLLRVGWTAAIRLPLVMPDSYLYLVYALLDPSFPIGDARPVVFPYLIAGSLFLFRHPIGILIVHNALSILAGGLFAAALRRRCGMSGTALGMLFYLLFAEKNLDFEYLLLTEHLSRILYLLFFATLLFYWKSRASFPQFVLGILAVLNILTKSSAVVLVPLFLLWRLTDREIGWSVSRLAKACAAFAATLLVSLSVYAVAGRRMLGFFPLSAMTGHALYYHVNPLTVFDRGEYPEIKEELKQFFPLYLKNYWSRGQNLGEWAIWGYPESREVARDFGSRSPAGAVEHYVAKHPSGPPFPQKDRILRSLALEAILQHPAQYVALSLRSLWSLLADGLTFTYGWKPFSDSPAYVQREAYLRGWFRVGQTPWPEESPPSRSGDGAVAAFATIERMSPVLRNWYLSVACIVPLTLAILLTAKARAAFAAELARVLAVLFGFVALYLVLLAFVCPGEPQRYLFNVQDVIVLIPLLLVSGAVRCVGTLD